MRNVRITTAVVGLFVLVGVAASCVAPTPPGARRVSPNDGTGYVDPVISGDGDTVLYRREADLEPGFDEPRDLVVTTVSTGATRVLPGVRDLTAVAGDGTAVLHGVGQVRWTDTTTGDTVTLRTGPGIGFGDSALSADGRTAAWMEYHLTGSWCPCELRLHVWRDGAEVLDLLLVPLDTGPADPSFDPFVSLDATGERVFLYRDSPRAIVEVDLGTGALEPVPVVFPPDPADVPPAGLDAFHRVETRVDAGTSDGASFRYVERGVPHLVAVGAAPVLLPANAISDPAPSISPNGRYVAYIQHTPSLPGQERLSYRVRDLVTGQTREVVASEAATDPRFDPASTFNGWGSVADTGRATFGQWAAPLSGPWPPSVIYVDR